MRRSLKIIGAVLIFAIGCGATYFAFTRPVGPPLRLNEDQCAVCAMGIWNPNFAAAVEVQTVGPDGTQRVEVRYYDDMGCLLDDEATNPDRPVRRVWVRDSTPGSARWLDAATAWYLMTTEIKTPMASGIAAFETFRQADRARRELNEPAAAGMLTDLRPLRAAWRKERGLNP